MMSNKKIIFICGERKRESSVAIYSVLKHYFRIKKYSGLPGFWSFLYFSKIIVIEDNNTDSPRKIRSFLSRHVSPVVVVTGLDSSARKKKILPKTNKFLVIGYSLSKKIHKKERVFTFGTRKKADVYVTDINKGEQTNFKVSHRGSVTPFWIKGRLKNQEIYGVLSALGVGLLFGLNLVEISTKIREEDMFTER